MDNSLLSDTDRKTMVKHAKKNVIKLKDPINQLQTASEKQPSFDSFEGGQKD